MAKEKNLFDYMNSIFYKKGIGEFSKKECNSWILSLWLSHDGELVNIVNRVNRNLFNIPDKLVYEYFWHTVPKRKRFIKWVKKEEKDKIKDKKVEELMMKHGVSKREALLSLTQNKEGE